MNCVLLGVGSGFICIGVGLYHMGIVQVKAMRQDGGCCVKGLGFIYAGMVLMGLSV